MKDILACLKKITPEDELLYEYCLGRGFKEEWFEEYKVLKWVPPKYMIENEDFCKIYYPKGEKLRDSIIFPFFDHTGDLIGFESRNVVDKLQLKFKFKEGAIILGLNKQALTRIWEGCNLWVVEGAFDLIALRWITDDLVFATGTASFSKHLLNILNRYFNREFIINILYDNDPPGIRGSERSVKKLDKIGITSRRYFVQSDTDKDPGDLWNKYGEHLIGTVGKGKIR